MLRGGKFGELGPSLAYNKEAAELLLPYIDQIVTNHVPGEDFKRDKSINKRLSVSLENNSVYKIEDLFKSIWKLYLKYNDGDHTLTDKMMRTAQKEIQKTILTYNDDQNSELQYWDEAHAYCAAIQFYLGNSYVEGEDEEEFDDQHSETTFKESEGPQHKV